MKKITADILSKIFGDNVNEANSWVKDQLATIAPDWRSKPVKPLLTSKKTSAEHRAYADALEVYEKEKEAWQVKAKEYEDIENATSWELEEYIKRESGLYTAVPEQYRSKVYAHAWQEGHSNGYTEVYNCLLDLVGIFE